MGDKYKWVMLFKKAMSRYTQNKFTFRFISSYKTHNNTINAGLTLLNCIMVIKLKQSLWFGEKSGAQ